MGAGVAPPHDDDDGFGVAPPHPPAAAYGLGVRDEALHAGVLPSPPYGFGVFAFAFHAGVFAGWCGFGVRESRLPPQAGVCEPAYGFAVRPPPRYGFGVPPPEAPDQTPGLRGTSIGVRATSIISREPSRLEDLSAPGRQRGH